jgi:hypothetical protein
LFTRSGKGAPSWGDLVMLMVAVSAVVVVAIAAFTLYHLHRTASDPVQAVYRAFTRKLARRGLTRQPAEGPLDFCRRVGRDAPALAAAAERVTQLYLAMRYGTEPLTRLRELRTLIRAFPR